MQTQFKKLPIESLQPGRYQPRQTFNKEGLEELAQSILTQGLIEPLIVRHVSVDRYEIIAGERRWRAAMLAGLADIPCLIGDYDDQHAAAVTLIENIQRENLNLLEEACGYQRLITEFHFNQEDIASLVGKSRSHIANILRLLSLCDAVQIYVRERLLSLGHARMLVGLEDNQQIVLAKRIIEQGLSVRQLENEVRQLKLISPNTKNIVPSEQDILHLQTQIAEQVGAPVQIITDSSTGGWLSIKFFDNDTLSGLLERMGLGYD